MSSFPENSTVGLVFQARYTLQPIMSYWGFISAIRMLTGNNIGVSPHIAETQAAGYQTAVRYFMDKTTHDYLIIMDVDVTPPDFGLEFLVKAFEQQENPGVMVALTFWQPGATPNLFKKAGTERIDSYSFPRYAPMMDKVGRFVVKYQHEAARGGNPLLLSPTEDAIIDVDTFNGGMFVVSREVLKKMGQLVFHERKGTAMGTFTNQVRLIGHSVKAAMHIVCSGGGVNHLDFLNKYGKPKE